jgi:outer membrane protein assembly factor BamA
MALSPFSTCILFIYRKKGAFLAYLYLLLAFPEIFAQPEDLTIGYPCNDSILCTPFDNDNKQLDVPDVLNDLFNPDHPFKDTSKVEKRKYDIACFPAIGYTLQTKLVALAGANIAFYNGNEHNVNLSVINISLNYTQKHQIIIPVLTNIWTKRNAYNLLGNWTFYKYPEYTYGLGGSDSKETPYPISYKYFLIRETLLKRMFSDFYAGIGYNLDYHSNIQEFRNQNMIVSDFDRYGKTARSVSSGLTLNLLYDQRRNPINPPKGFYGNIVYRPNYIFMGSDHNWQSLLIDVRTYLKLSENSGNVLAFWSYNLFTLSGKPPYLDLPSNGWDNNTTQGRGYIQSRFRGRDLISFETEYRFRLTNNGLLGGVLFTGAQTLPNWPGNRMNSIFPSAGAGLRIKINKHSDTNLAIDYGFGIEGSKGIFINLGEAF